MPVQVVHFWMWKNGNFHAVGAREIAKIIGEQKGMNKVTNTLKQRYERQLEEIAEKLKAGGHDDKKRTV